MKFTNCLLRLIALVNILFITLLCNAQEPSGSLLEDILEDVSVHNDVNSSVDNLQWEDELEELAARLQQPLNLNVVTREQLEQFPFLTAYQIEQLLAYIYLNGQMLTIYELKLVKGMDRQTINRLLPFVCVEVVHKEADLRLKTLLKEAVKKGRNEILTRMDIPLYRRQGYQQAYRGSPVYNSVRYSFRYNNRLQAGVTAEKDAGEPLFASHNRSGYDFYSGYLLLKNQGGLKTLALGDYRLSFGQGLVLSTDFLMGKTIYASAFNRRGTGIKKHASTDEYNYFRGVAATVGVAKRWELSAFYSHRRLDGTMNDGELSSIYQAGLHRSGQEADKKHRIVLQSMGGNLAYRRKNLRLAATGIYYFFDRPYEPKRSGYSRYYLHGKHFYNVGLDYVWSHRCFSLQGEVAKGKQGWATVNRLQYTPHQDTRFLFIQRFYAYDYWALFARSFSEGGAVQNEHGYYLGVETSPWAYWKFMASFDLFFFPWRKYRISKPSGGVDGLLQADFTPTDRLTMFARYRLKRKERDEAGSRGAQIDPTLHHQLRYRIGYSPEDWLALSTTIDYNHFRIGGHKPGDGYRITQRISSRLPFFPLSVDLQGSYFSTDDYDSRVYITESSLLHSFYTPSFSGRGFRFSLRLKYEWRDRLLLLAKWGETVYTDRREIGSGNDRITGNRKSDLQFQFRVKF